MRRTFNQIGGKQNDIVDGLSLALACGGRAQLPVQSIGRSMSTIFLARLSRLCVEVRGLMVSGGGNGLHEVSMIFLLLCCSHLETMAIRVDFTLIFFDKFGFEGCPISLSFPFFRLIFGFCPNALLVLF